ncbi:hypothetical protein BDQ12DRAFT_654967 [Crucibulum laeve]|uniref:DUF6534 domain-containing protein n=1 Tax=Crucibulum laeve TaxID=68775 RepID=A0A5C3LTN6_9AGAR|nr:hypothetical protein BDQ12DRAFT_654967 [Crucibulum laeve]
MGEYDDIIGSLLVGIFFNTFLYGLVCYQFIIYANTKHDDPLWIRIIVWTLFTTDTGHSMVAMYNGYNMCVTNYGKPESFLHVSWTVPVLAIATAWAAILTQFFLGHRVYVFTRNKALVIFLGIASCAAFVCAVYAGVLAILVKSTSEFGRLKPTVTAWLALQTMTDWIITITLSYVLLRSKTGIGRTNTVIHRLIRGAVQTGVFASVFALGDMFSFLLLQNTNFYAMFAYPIGRIYTNTLMDTLNARPHIRSMLEPTVDVDLGAESSAVFQMQTRSHTVPGRSLQTEDETSTDTSPEGSSTKYARSTTHQDEDLYPQGYKAV